jgi:hypothetical protein
MGCSRGGGRRRGAGEGVLGCLLRSKLWVCEGCWLERVGPEEIAGVCVQVDRWASLSVLYWGGPCINLQRNIWRAV